MLNLSVLDSIKNKKYAKIQKYKNKKNKKNTKIHSFFFRELQRITVLLLIYNTYTN